MNDKNRSIIFLVFCTYLVSAFLYGCSARPHITPRSKLVKSAEGTGVYLSSIQDDRARFFNFETEQEERLWSLIRSRSSSGFRNPDYLLGPGDELEIAVFDVPELNLTTVIRQSGFISLPLLGAVQSTGLTESALAQSITARLAEFVHDPQVSVFITNYGSQKVSVIGAVNQPGRYALKKGANSILELLSEAGGLSQQAGNYLNFIPGDLAGIRSGERQSGDQDHSVRASFNSIADQKGAESHALEIPLDRLLGTSGQVPLELPVQHGDMIIIPEAGSVQVDGEVLKVGTYVLGKRMTLLGALAASGGITYGAKIDEVEVIRPIKGDNIHLVLNLEDIATGKEKDLRLKDGDIIRVPSHGGRRVRQDTFDAITRIINFGVGGSVNLAQ